MNEQEQNSLYFVNLIMSLAQSAYIGMGKVTNPMTGKTEKNMELAKANIDIIQMLKSKTAGNLTKEENQLISDTLTSLQLTYADEAKKQEDITPEPAEEDQPEEENAESPEEEAEPEEEEKKEEDNQ